ncbi:helix-turn-helix domain-containing protein [Arenicella sp.]|nr:helix-turn-helix domain-containing protein [Arenicella sp.]
MSQKQVSNSDRVTYRRARLARDARFDGQFFTAVKTTGIYCRSICPANPPMERNVDYYLTAIGAAQAEFRPCLRCRPDSAPHSYAWLGTRTTFQRALDLLTKAESEHNSIPDMARRLGISDRYLRDLFNTYLGVSPKKYQIYQQCLFAKQLLHDTALPITQIAFAAGFNSVRRFNEAMQQRLALTPTQIRNRSRPITSMLSLKLYYRPPFAWQHSHNFLRKRAIINLEWSEKGSYSRTIRYRDSKGYFTVENIAAENYLLLHINLDDYQHLYAVVQRIRALFDLDASIEQIDQQLGAQLPGAFNYLIGLRVPGIWSTFEAGIRAILGQQVTVTQAQNLVAILVEKLGDNLTIEGQSVRKLFPEPRQICNQSLHFLRMPQARKDAILHLAEYFASEPDSDNIDHWLGLKGIGPWTIDYVKMRGSKDPDIWLAGDAGINNVLKRFNIDLDTQKSKPWRSYLTMQLWNQLNG